MMIDRLSPPPARPHRGLRWLVFALLCLSLAACAERTTREQQVRAVIAAGAAAAEARNLTAMMALVSPRYQDAGGGSAVELARTLRFYLLANQSVHVLTRIDRIDFPYRDLARVRLTVGTLGRELAAGATFDLAANLHEVHLELQLERGEWKVTRAEWTAVLRA